MELKLGHDIKVRVGENKKKYIRPHSTYLFGIEEEEKWPEVAGRGRQQECPVLRLVLCPAPVPLVQVLVLEAGTAKSGYIAILIGDIFG